MYDHYLENLYFVVDIKLVLLLSEVQLSGW